MFKTETRFNKGKIQLYFSPVKCFSSANLSWLLTRLEERTICSDKGMTSEPDSPRKEHFEWAKKHEKDSGTCTVSLPLSTLAIGTNPY